MPREAAKSAGAAERGRLQDWNLLRSFIAVYELGTLTAAAEALALTQPTLGRHVRELEALVGETLFDRLPQRLQPNQRAHDLFQSLGPLREGALGFERSLFEPAGLVSGTVRVTTGEAFGSLVPALLAGLMTDAPGLHVELTATNDVENLVRREADIAVRFFRPDQGDLIATCVGEGELGLYAHQRFLATRPAPASPRDLFGHFIGSVDLTRTFELAAAMGFPMQPADFRLRSASEIVQLAAIEAGLGVGVTWVALARQRPGLVRLFEQAVTHRVPVWLCAHDDLRRSPRLKRVFNHLADALRRELPPAPAGSA